MLNMDQNQSFMARHGGTIQIACVALGTVAAVAGTTFAILDRPKKTQLALVTEKVNVLEKNVAIQANVIDRVEKRVDEHNERMNRMNEVDLASLAKIQQCEEMLGIAVPKTVQVSEGVRPLNRSVAKPKPAVGTEG
jgi:uncharacterized coiled-coil protein SlyX